ncbi:galaxin-like isoform X1 [Saccostrea cucullata]|uniref:galaxin-like isoform X1 n=1 Tax=Saccostrea cuccullata TaxID=36930 RepID=UPI002ED57621
MSLCVTVLSFGAFLFLPAADSFYYGQDAVCRTTTYNPGFGICCDGVVNSISSGTSCCGTSAFYRGFAICCNGVVNSISSSTSCCGTTAFNRGFASCCNGVVNNISSGTSCCGISAYNPGFHSLHSSGQRIPHNDFVFDIPFTSLPSYCKVITWTSCLWNSDIQPNVQYLLQRSVK